MEQRACLGSLCLSGYFAYRLSEIWEGFWKSVEIRCKIVHVSILTAYTAEYCQWGIKIWPGCGTFAELCGTLRKAAG
jgi:hypothetical protein